jgi:hypothetical protein
MGGISLNFMPREQLWTLTAKFKHEEIWNLTFIATRKMSELLDENAWSNTSEPITHTIKNLEEEFCCTHSPLLNSPSDFYQSCSLLDNLQGHYYMADEALQNAVCQ